ncbi:hypothetical protein E1B28_008929 [Marasmius oreades]|uniref:Uncharacterized protein n=1 Tax=Marasmius oreades TaxID=181124 RepID=A0A9P7S0M5_9AGAR|nr:uncharacterized protein E1B28_008929 [Marasmius oreades]KAG7092586.1 hypothetical protein E1B28_008929 [Marasmius oreades]
MPSEYLLGDSPPLEIQPSQVKLCAQCHHSVDPGAYVFIPGAEAILCAGCLSSRSPVIQQSSPIDVDPRSTPRPLFSTREDSGISCSFDSDIEIASSDCTTQPDCLYHEREISSSFPSKPSLPTGNVTTPSVVISQNPVSSSSSPATTSYQRRNNRASLSPSPLTDITHLRVRSQGYHCLYPGATFQGTQKSGRNSYEVNVTIVDVDFSSSFLCGYLRICGLTHDWPELTTYFDAEIIGSRYGFLTQSWGATEQEDLVHWSRFPAFRHVKHELQKPQLTMCDRDRGAVFMRWKERFLVPDHRVQDISGASFAGEWSRYWPGSDTELFARLLLCLRRFQPFDIKTFRT